MIHFSADTFDCDKKQRFQMEDFQKKILHILHLNINSLLLRFIAKRSNASIIGISESKLDSSFEH